MNHNEDEPRSSLETFGALLGLWLITAFCSWVGGWFALYIAIVLPLLIGWLAFSLPLLMWMLLMREGLQRIFGPATDETRVRFVLSYAGFVVSQLAAFGWIIMQAQNGPIGPSF